MLFIAAIKAVCLWLVLNDAPINISRSWPRIMICMDWPLAVNWNHWRGSLDNNLHCCNEDHMAVSLRKKNDRRSEDCKHHSVELCNTQEEKLASKPGENNKCTVSARNECRYHREQKTYIELLLKTMSFAVTTNTRWMRFLARDFANYGTLMVVWGHVNHCVTFAIEYLGNR